MTQINPDKQDLPSVLLDEYTKFVKSIKKKGFNFLVAIYNDVSTRKTIIDHLSSLYTTSCVIDTAVEKTPDHYDFERKIQEAAQHSTIEHIINIEYRPDAEFISFLQSINFHRELLAKLAPVNFVIWILEYRAKDLITIAGDLWSWNSGVFTFTIEKEPTPLEPLPENPEIVELNFASTRERIRSLIEYLAPKPPDALSEGEKSLLAELQKHYDNIDEYEKTYNFLDEELRSLRDRSSIVLNTEGKTVDFSVDEKKSWRIGHEDLSATEPYDTFHNNHVFFHNDLGNIEKALYSEINTIGILDKILPPDHPSLATSYNNLSTLYEELGNMGKSLEYERKAVTIREKSLPANHPHLINSYHHLSSLYHTLDDEEKSREYAAKAEAASATTALPEK